MKAKAIGTLLICGFAVMAWLEAACSSADQPKSLKQPSLEPKPIKTDFAAGANLLPSELKQVVALAKQSGIDDVAEVNTFHYVPAGGRGISVKSVERADGRNTSHDSILVHKSSWDDFVPGKNGVKRDGNFWVDVDGKRTTLLRSYEFNGQPVRIEIGEGADIAFADKVIALIAAKKVRFADHFDRQEFEKLANSKPTAICRSRFKQEYELQFIGAGICSLTFAFENGQVILTGVARILI